MKTERLTKEEGKLMEAVMDPSNPIGKRRRKLPSSGSTPAKVPSRNALPPLTPSSITFLTGRPAVASTISPKIHVSRGKWKLSEEQQDAIDVAECERRMADPNDVRISWDDLKAELFGENPQFLSDLSVK